MGNKSQSPLISQRSDLNRSYSIEPPNKLIVSMAQRVHNQMKSPLLPLQTSIKQEKKEENEEKNVNTENYMNLDENYASENPENYFSANENQNLKFGSNYSSINHKKNVGFKHGKATKIIVNCEFERFFFEFPLEVRFLILSFLIDDYLNLTSVSPLWYCKINETFDEILVNYIDNGFIKVHMEILGLKNAYFSHTILRKGFRLDRNIVAETFESLKNKFVTISYDFDWKDERLCAEFRFDVVKKGKRYIWIYKEDCLHNYDNVKLGLIQPLFPISTGDSLKFAVNFYNPKGFIDITKIKWKPPIISDIPEFPKSLNRRIKGLDMDRISEVEIIHDIWVDYKYFEHKFKMNLDLLGPELTLIDHKCAGVQEGILTNRVKYKATSLGAVPDAMNIFGVNVEIFDDNSELISEIKKRGLAYDLENTLHIRLGDIIIFYLSSGN